MKNEATKPDTQSRWKHRYYEALDELEEKEKSWREVERLLRHLISRLALAADSRHITLNKKLTELRNAIRDGYEVDRLRKLIDNVSERVVELDQMRKQEDKRGHPATLFVETLEKIDLPGSHAREFRKFKKQVKYLAKDAPSDCMNEEFIKLLRTITGNDSVPEEKPSRRQRIMDRIMSRQQETTDKTDSVDNEESNADVDAEEELGPTREDKKNIKMDPYLKFVAPAVGDLFLQLISRMPDQVKERINFSVLKKHTNRARARKDLLPVVDVIAQQIDVAYGSVGSDTINIDDKSLGAITEAIQQFFEQLDPPIDLKQRIVELERVFVEKHHDIDSVIHCLNGLAEIVHDLCERLAFQKHELESFFIDLSNRLQELDAGLQKTTAMNERGIANSQAMDKAVHVEIQKIQASLDGERLLASEEFGPLKAMVQERLDTIDQHLQAFQDAEASRLEESQVLIKDLTEKVQMLEAEGDKLRNHLEETQQQSKLDTLTGIPNRQAYEERLANEVARSRRYRSDLCLVVWDVDKFKSVNDSYGHAAGDKVLRVVAETLQKQIRATDFLARFGGEEFVLLLPETKLSEARHVADKLRQTIADTPFHFRDNRVVVTISGGVAQLESEEHANNLFERADKLLYAAKENGRNRVEIAD